MALRDQPYLPLYVQDYLTDEKLNMCSTATQGIYIKIMCLMHKSEQYGKILLRQKFKQHDNICLNLSSQLAKNLPFSQEEIYTALCELTTEGVCHIEGNCLCQKRMVRDNYISEQRANAGSKGGFKTHFAKANNKAKSQANNKANTEYENEYDNENEINNISQEEMQEKGELETVEDHEFYPFDEFWNDYDKKVGEKGKLEKKWSKVSISDRKAIKEYLPRYKESQPDKKFRKNPETFLNNKSWNDELISLGFKALPAKKGVTMVEAQEIFKEITGQQ